MTALELSSKHSYVLVQIRYGNPEVVAGYTNWSQDVVDGLLYASTPVMEIDLPENTGTFKERQAQIRLPLDALTDLLSSGQQVPLVTCIVQEFSSAAEGSSSADKLTLYKGFLHSAVRNTRSRNNTILLRFETLKEQLLASAGVPANHHCSHPFGGHGCFFNTATFIKVGTVTAISQQGATITGVVAPAAPGGSLGSTMYRKGYIERDGIRILIRDWNSASPDSFVLARRPPTSWIGLTVAVNPGCSKEIEVCRGRWDNEEHFGGYGYAIPAYMPVLETQ